MIEGTREVLGLLQGRWSVDVLYLLAGGTRRYNEIFYEVGEISKKTLTHTLRALERNGLVARRVQEEVPVRRVDYSLTSPRLEPQLAAHGDVRVVGRRRRHAAARPPAARGLQTPALRGRRLIACGDQSSPGTGGQ